MTFKWQKVSENFHISNKKVMMSAKVRSFEKKLTVYQSNCTNQRRIQNPVKHRRLSVSRKFLQCFYSKIVGGNTFSFQTRLRSHGN